MNLSSHISCVSRTIDGRRLDRPPEWRLFILQKANLRTVNLSVQKCSPLLVTIVVILSVSACGTRSSPSELRLRETMSSLCSIDSSSQDFASKIKPYMVVEIYSETDDDRLAIVAKDAKEDLDTLKSIVGRKPISEIRINREEGTAEIILGKGDDQAVVDWSNQKGDWKWIPPFYSGSVSSNRLEAD